MTKTREEISAYPFMQNPGDLRLPKGVTITAKPITILPTNIFEVNFAARNGYQEKVEPNPNADSTEELVLTERWVPNNNL